MIPQLPEKFMAQKRIARLGISFMGFIGLNSIFAGFPFRNALQSFFQFGGNQDHLVSGISFQKMDASLPNASNSLQFGVKVSGSIIYLIPCLGYFGFASQSPPKYSNTQEDILQKGVSAYFLDFARRVLLGMTAFFGTNLACALDAPSLSSDAVLVRKTEQFSISSI